MNVYLLQLLGKWLSLVMIAFLLIPIKSGTLYSFPSEIVTMIVSLFFIINLKTGKIIKNPDMKDVISKYKIKVDFNKSYTQTEIFGEHRSLRAIQRLNEDIKQIIYNEPICDYHIQ